MERKYPHVNFIIFYLSQNLKKIIGIIIASLVFCNIGFAEIREIENQHFNVLIEEIERADSIEKVNEKIIFNCVLWCV